VIEPAARMIMESAGVLRQFYWNRQHVLASEDWDRQAWENWEEEEDFSFMWRERDERVILSLDRMAPWWWTTIWTTGSSSSDSSSSSSSWRKGGVFFEVPAAQRGPGHRTWIGCGAKRRRVGEQEASVPRAARSLTDRRR